MAKLCEYLCGGVFVQPQPPLLNVARKHVIWSGRSVIVLRIDLCAWARVSVDSLHCTAHDIWDAERVVLLAWTWKWFARTLTVWAAELTIESGVTLMKMIRCSPAIERRARSHDVRVASTVSLLKYICLFVWHSIRRRQHEIAEYLDYTRNDQTDAHACKQSAMHNFVIILIYIYNRHVTHNYMCNVTRAYQ